MSSIFSLISILAVVAIAIWWFGLNTSPASLPSESATETKGQEVETDDFSNRVTAPIDAARGAKALIENNSASTLDLDN
jgi:hypothetical protein